MGLNLKSNSYQQVFDKNMNLLKRKHNATESNNPSRNYGFYKVEEVHAPQKALHH